METSTELIIADKINALELYTNPEKVDPLLEGIAQKVREFVPDLRTSKSRREIKSLARKVAFSKAALDEMGKNLVSDWKTKAKKVDVVRKHIRDTLDDLRDEVRKPLTDWEKAEENRLKKLALQEEIDQAWDEAHKHNELVEREKEIARKEAELAKAEEKRLQAEHEERLKKEAAEKAKRKAEEKAENERQEILMREAKANAAAENAEKEKAKAIERAEQEKLEAIAAEKKRSEDAAKQAEHARIVAEQKKKDEDEKRAANLEHRRAINQEALSDLLKIGLMDKAARDVITAIASGKISNITINY